MTHSSRIILIGSKTRFRLLAMVLLLACMTAGCATSSNKWVTLRATPRNPLTETLGLVTRSGPKPTEKTIQLLRRHDLEDELSENRATLLARLDQIDQQEPRRVNAYAMAELAYVGAKREEQAKHIDQALELYGSAVLHAYRYLFDDKYGGASNSYDPNSAGHAISTMRPSKARCESYKPKETYGPVPRRSFKLPIIIASLISN